MVLGGIRNYFMNIINTENLIIINADVIEALKTLPDKSVNCCVTSPPYYGLRDYKVAGQIGLEETPEEYVNKQVEVFREVKRVLKDDGTLWLNIGDSYAANRSYQVHNTIGTEGHTYSSGSTVPDGLKAKDLIGIPWKVAFALQADGWYLRQDIIWEKPNCMPESVKDRCTKSHEYVFLLSKSKSYYFDHESIREPSAKDGLKNKRSVWTINTKPYKGAHFATFPTDLVKPCVFAGCPVGGTILDPFGGSGTTGQVAIELGRKAILIELNSEYISLIQQRCGVKQPIVETPATL